MKFLPQNFNDFLALVLIFGILGVWLLQGCGQVEMPTEVNGGLLVTWTLIVQFYYRKKSGEEAP